MKMFDAGSFADLADTEMGLAIWEFLNADEIFIRMETATYLRRPALEGLQPQLLAQFGDKIKNDRCKQMMGRMTRQIMEGHGYSLDMPGVRITGGELFSSAARYKK